MFSLFRLLPLLAIGAMSFGGCREVAPDPKPADYRRRPMRVGRRKSPTGNRLDTLRAQRKAQRQAKRKGRR